MREYVGCLVVVGCFGALAAIGAVYEWVTALIQKARFLKRRETELQERARADREAIALLADEKCSGFPWLAKAYADYFHLQAIREADAMEKKHPPAPRSAERLREMGRQRRNVEVKLRIAQGLLKYYHELFPFLEDFSGDVDDETVQRVLSADVSEPARDISEIGVDPLQVYLSKEEYEKLTTAERNQLGLDRYRERRKSKWEIGRDYERYIGYVYERDGYAVSYEGILEGLEDLGRDLVCRKGDQTQVVQCKCWSQHRQIHEKHITQLFGTTVKFEIEHQGEQATPVLFTSTRLSDRAAEFAAHLGVIVREGVRLAEYPSVKCNVSRRTGERIYHLPFDQMYDRTVIEQERNECYVWSATEAEALGFRRAWRWIGDTGDVEV